MRTAIPAVCALALLAFAAPAQASEPAPPPDAPHEAIGQPGQPIVVSPGVRVLRDAPPPKPIPPELLAQLLRMESERAAESDAHASRPAAPR